MGGRGGGGGRSGRGGGGGLTATSSTQAIQQMYDSLPPRLQTFVSGNLRGIRSRGRLQFSEPPSALGITQSQVSAFNRSGMGTITATAQGNTIVTAGPGWRNIANNRSQFDL